MKFKTNISELEQGDEIRICVGSKAGLWEKAIVLFIKEGKPFVKVIGFSTLHGWIGDFNQFGWPWYYVGKHQTLFQKIKKLFS